MDSSPFNLAFVPTLLPPLYLARSTLFSLDDTYIFDVTATTDQFVVSASNHKIKLYNPETLSINRTLSFHTNNVSQIKFHKDNFLLSSSKDGSIAMWDLRTNAKPAHVFKAHHQEALLCFDINDEILAAGTELIRDREAKILFWDARTTAVLSEFVESHSEDVTQIHFHPTKPNTLLSASVDGLVCIYDVTLFDEDEALVAVVNSGSSVSKAGFFGPNAEYLYCLTHIETFSLHTATEGDLVCNFGDVRRASQPDILQLDYIIDCKYDLDTQRLYMVGGSNSGDINLLHVNVNQLQLCRVLRGGHTEVVRSVHWDTKTNMLLSGAEDAKLCLWTGTHIDKPVVVPTPKPVAPIKHNVHHRKRHTPY